MDECGNSVKTLLLNCTNTSHPAKVGSSQMGAEIYALNIIYMSFDQNKDLRSTKLNIYGDVI